MISVTAKQMREIDRYTIEEIGIPSIVLMENAKNAMINFIPLDGYEKYIIVAGVGNNGGDGLAMARDLILEEKETLVFVVGDISKASKDFLINYNILKNIKANIVNIKEDKDLIQLKESLTVGDIIVDAIFGTGLNSDVRGIAVKVIKVLNKSKSFKFSVDIPSGLNADTGEVQGIAVQADYVVTLGLMKKGLKDYNGQVTVENIGIPQIAIKKVLEK